jgi:hypothetical protein
MNHWDFQNQYRGFGGLEGLGQLGNPRWKPGTKSKTFWYVRYRQISLDNAIR